MMSTIPRERGTTNEELPREMQAHFYPIQFEMEETNWWYRGRRRILELFVRDAVEKTRALSPAFRRPSVQEMPAKAGTHNAGSQTVRILDVGCGTGANLIMLDQFGEAHGLDVSADALEFCHTRGLDRVKLGAAEQLPYADGEFDLVTALDVVEHLDDDLAGLREMHRVLRPNGRILLFVPAFMFLWGVQDEVSHHRRRYRLPELEKVVAEAGFTVERATYANISFFVPIAIVRWILRRTGAKPSSEFALSPPFVNWIFTRVFGAERFFLKRWNLPFGVSALLIARRENN